MIANLNKIPFYSFAYELGDVEVASILAQYRQAATKNAKEDLAAKYDTSIYSLYNLVAAVS